MSRGGRFQHHEEEAGATELVFGRRPVLEVLEAGQRSLHKIWLQEGTGGPAVDKILDLARDKGVPTEWVHRAFIDQRLGQRDAHHQGVLAQVSSVSFGDLYDFLKQLGPGAPALLVGLDEIQDPQNIGAILRSAGFFGVDGLMVTRWRTAPIGDAATRVSAGAIEHVPLLRVKNLAESVLELQEAGFEVIGADMAGEPIAGYKPGKRTALLLGNEGDGLRRLVKERCDKLLSIPGSGKVASLNVGAAAAIFLHHLKFSK